MLINCDVYLQLKNFGPSPLEKVDLEFEIPVSYAGKKCFFQISDIKVRMFAYVRTETKTLTEREYEFPLHIAISISRCLPTRQMFSAKI